MSREDIVKLRGDSKASRNDRGGAGLFPSAVLGNSTAYIGTTAIALNRSSASQTLTGVSIDGNAATVTNGITTSNYNTYTIKRSGSAGSANLNSNTYFKIGRAHV